MYKSLVIALSALLLVSTLLLAHGAPILGTITAMDKDSITVTDKDGKNIVIGLEKATKYVKDKKPATMGDLKVGTRVVIDAHQDEKTKAYKAEEVQIGVAAPEAKSAAKKAPKPNR